MIFWFDPRYPGIICMTNPSKSRYTKIEKSHHDDDTETPDPDQAQIPSHPGIKYLVRGIPPSDSSLGTMGTWAGPDPEAFQPQDGLIFKTLPGLGAREAINPSIPG